MVRLWIDRRYIDSFELQQVTPQPDSMGLVVERLIFTFRRAEREGATAITFNMKPSRFGSLSGQVGLIDGPTLQLQQFVYP